MEKKAVDSTNIFTVLDAVVADQKTSNDVLIMCEDIDTVIRLVDTLSDYGYVASSLEELSSIIDCQTLVDNVEENGDADIAEYGVRVYPSGFLMYTVLSTNILQTLRDRDFSANTPYRFVKMADNLIEVTADVEDQTLDYLVSEVLPRKGVNPFEYEPTKRAQTVLFTYADITGVKTKDLPKELPLASVSDLYEELGDDDDGITLVFDSIWGKLSKSLPSGVQAFTFNPLRGFGPFISDEDGIGEDRDDGDERLININSSEELATTIKIVLAFYALTGGDTDDMCSISIFNNGRIALDSAMTAQSRLASYIDRTSAEEEGEGLSIYSIVEED